jgi:hypothetical protein
VTWLKRVESDVVFLTQCKPGRWGKLGRANRSVNFHEVLASDSSAKAANSAHRNVAPTDNALQKSVYLPPETMGSPRYTLAPIPGNLPPLQTAPRFRYSR